MMVSTLSRRPISRASRFLSLNENAEARATTNSRLIFVSALSSSSAKPSQKYSLSGSVLRLRNGSTAIDRITVGDIRQAHVLFEPTDLRIAVTDGDGQFRLCEAGASTQIPQQLAEGRKPIQHLRGDRNGHIPCIPPRIPLSAEAHT